MKVRINITGNAPLIMHNVQLANPLNPITKEIKAISSKRKKTEEDYERMSWLEFQGSLYLDEVVGPFIPGLNIESAIKEGARITKEGKQVEAGLFCTEPAVSLLYTGPRTAEALYANANFVDVRAVRVNAARVMRTRPIFRSWALEADVEIDSGQIDVHRLREWVAAAGALKGLGDHRPSFGRFTAEVQTL